MQYCVRRAAAVAALLIAGIFLSSCGGGGVSGGPAPSAGGFVPAPKGSSLSSSVFVYTPNVSGTITAFPATANGNVSPALEIAGSNTGLVAQQPFGLAFDSAGNLYVSLFGGGVGCVTCVYVFAPGASGNVAPIPMLCGGNTGLSEREGIAVDSAGNLYVANHANSSITVYAPGANGNTAPIATIAGSNTQLEFPNGLAVDKDGKIYVTASGPDIGGSRVNVYAAHASGNVAPIASISGSNAQFQQPNGIAIDSAGNIYVANLVGSFNSGTITVFAPGSNGNVAPSSIISGANTQLSEPLGVAVASDGTLFVTNVGLPPGAAINIYSPGATGDAIPIGVIRGSNTQLSPAFPAIH